MITNLYFVNWQNFFFWRRTTRQCTHWWPAICSGKSDGVTYWWQVISFSCFFVWQCIVPIIAMYYSKSFGLKKLKSMFLEEKNWKCDGVTYTIFQNGLIWNFKNSLGDCHKWFLIMVSGALTGVGRIKHEYKREKEEKIPCYTVALGIYLRITKSSEYTVHILGV